MRILINDTDGNRTLLEASIMSLELTSRETPIVWIITDDAGDTYFSKDERLIDNFYQLAKSALVNGYVDLSDYDVFVDVGIDEDEDDDYDDEDDEDFLFGDDDEEDGDDDVPF